MHVRETECVVSRWPESEPTLISASTDEPSPPPPLLKHTSLQPAKSTPATRLTTSEHKQRILDHFQLTETWLLYKHEHTHTHTHTHTRTGKRGSAHRLRTRTDNSFSAEEYIHLN